MGKGKITGEEIKKREKEIAEIKKLLAEEEDLLAKEKAIIPSTIPVEPQDVSYPPMPQPQLPFRQSLPKQSLDHLTPSQAAYEVSIELNKERRLGLMGIGSIFITAITGMFSIGFGMIAVILLSFYFGFELIMTYRKRMYLRQTYGV